MLRFAILLTCMVGGLLPVQVAPAEPNGVTPGPSQVPEGDNCGVQALYAVIRLLGSEAKLADVSQVIASRQKGFSLLALQEAAQELGFFAYAVRLTPEDLYRSGWPAIAYMNEIYDPDKHFAAVVGRKQEQLVIFDPPGRLRYFPMAYFTEYWDGETLVVSREPVEMALLAPEAVRNAQMARAGPWHKSIPITMAAVILIGAGVVCLRRGVAGQRQNPALEKDGPETEA